MNCPKCGTELPDEALFCMKCGTDLTTSQEKQSSSLATPVLAGSEATSLKCPNCGGSISPQFGEMIITCEYCGTSVLLGSDGWRSIQKHTMLTPDFGDRNRVNAEIHALMDRGILHRHLEEDSTLEDMNLGMIPYWIVSASARTSIVATDVASNVGQTVTEAALLGLMMGGGGFGRRGRFYMGGPMMGAMMGSSMMAGQGGIRKTYEMDTNYNFPVVAVKALVEYQPKDYQFRLDRRTFFDISKIPKDVKVLNGDIGEEAANYQTKALVSQLQSDRAHAQYHMIQQLQTQVDISETELLHVPIWFIRFDHSGDKIVLVIDGNQGNVINSIGL